MHPFYNAYGGGGGAAAAANAAVDHLYEDNNWVAPPTNTPMKDIEGRRRLRVYLIMCIVRRFSNFLL